MSLLEAAVHIKINTMNLSFRDAAVVSFEELIQKLGTKRSGITSEEAHHRLSMLGKNIIAKYRIHWWKLILNQFASSFMYLLTAAVIISLFLGETIDALFILLFIGINTLLGFFQEYRSEKAIASLEKYVIQTTHVRRDNRVQLVNVEELVAGDIVLLAAGDKIPADIRFFETENIQVDESILTGESISVTKIANMEITRPADYYQATNIGFSGTLLIAGKGEALVFATGSQTQVGILSLLSQTTEPVSPFQLQMRKLSTAILKITVVTVVILFLLQVLIKGTNFEIGSFALFTIALAVGVVPEALPFVITISLSAGAVRLARKKVIPRRLSAIEDLGSIDVLCTDKTGTITQNSLTVSDLFGDNPDRLLHLGALASSLRNEHERQPNNAFDLGIWQKLSATEKTNMQTVSPRAELPFDPHRRRNSVLVVDNKEKILIVRGAVEELLPRCKKMEKKNRATNLTDQYASHGLLWSKEHGIKGERTIAVAIKKLPSRSKITEADETDLTFIGMIAFIDPLKKTTIEAIESAKKLAVAVKIITGDSAGVAGSVGKNIGLIASSDQVLTGLELTAMSEEEKRTAVERFSVFARINPEQKYEIIALLRRTHTVGFLGEGFNDVPALKLADVAIAVAGASDIAKDASDIILLNKSLLVITNGIAEGRKTYTNSLKYIKATLSANFGNFYALAFSSLSIPFLPLLPLQILLVNLLSDFPLMSIATDSVDMHDLRKPSHFKMRDLLILMIILGLVSTLFDFAFFGYFVRFGPQVLRTMWFIGSVLTECIFLFSIRTTGPFYKASLPSLWVLVLTISASIITILLPYSAWGQTFFGFVSPTASYMSVALIFTAAFFVCSEVVKLSYYHIKYLRLSK